MSTDVTAGRPTQEISVEINGERITAEVEPRLKVSDFLRNHVDLKSVRVGCEHGVCGACTISVDDTLSKSCLMYAVQLDGKEVTTVEGFDRSGSLHPVQEAFHEEHALQCGFCTSGFMMAARDLLEKNPDPSRSEIKQALSDNICRCTGYHNIFDAVEKAAEKMEGEE